MGSNCSYGVTQNALHDTNLCNAVSGDISQFLRASGSSQSKHCFRFQWDDAFVIAFCSAFSAHHTPGHQLHFPLEFSFRPNRAQ